VIWAVWLVSVVRQIAFTCRNGGAHQRLEPQEAKAPGVAPGALTFIRAVINNSRCWCRLLVQTKWRNDGAFTHSGCVTVAWGEVEGTSTL
jgi:hypothetical protein